MSDELQTMDRYPSDFLHLSLLGFSIDIENEALGTAIEESLSDKKRTILLLYYFLDMNENEIADLFHVSASTVNRQRHQALKAIRNYMEEHENEY
ncbi:sigma-70 family RNA polymerase sigma factor [Lactobacillus sp. UCMA15818]|uniref:RNA polymerase sigma factor n=1 Tax=Lactobacillus sp. UCMA15818 TaxID=2583394 RepID=UPI0025B1E77D|nr:sigma-70 family RNA polymerase sigma factor [Lactobacillus sp. UCMA15818]MDN2454115.1 sigma-70 family RNA polymerase sigma factor [Lactobacillus sp. UCMA15818]